MAHRSWCFGRSRALRLRPRPRGFSLSGQDISSRRILPPAGGAESSPGRKPGDPCRQQDKPRTGRRNTRSVQPLPMGILHASTRRLLTLRHRLGPSVRLGLRTSKSAGVPYDKKVRPAGGSRPTLRPASTHFQGGIHRNGLKAGTRLSPTSIGGSPGMLSRASIVSLGPKRRNVKWENHLAIRAGSSTGQDLAGATKSAVSRE